MPQPPPPPPPLPPVLAPPPPVVPTVHKGTTTAPPPPPSAKGTTTAPPPPSKGTTKPPPMDEQYGPAEPGDVYEKVTKSGVVIKRAVIKVWKYKSIYKLQYVTIEGGDPDTTCVTTVWRFLHHTPRRVQRGFVIPDTIDCAISTAHDLTEVTWSEGQHLKGIPSLELTEIERQELQRYEAIHKNQKQRYAGIRT